MALLRIGRNRSLQDPFSDMARLLDLFTEEPLFDGLFDHSYSPEVDVLEEDEGVKILMNVPGIDKKDLEITLADNVLTLKGERKAKEEKRRIYKDESWTGTFQRTIPLPPTVNPDKVSAELSDGVLRISIPKKPESKPRQIAVSVR